MSVRIMTAVWRVSLPDSEKLVLLALADCANDEGHCWPSMRSLVAKCSKSDRTIQASIKALCEAGHLTRREVSGKGCNYTVHPRSDVTPEAASPPKPLTSTPEAASDKPSRTVIPSEAKASSGKRAKKKFVLPSHIPAEPWQDFCDMRRRIGKPMTLRAMELAVGRLDKLAEDGWPPGDVLNHCTLNSYQGIYPPKDQRNDRPPGQQRRSVTEGLWDDSAGDPPGRGGSGSALPGASEHVH